MNEIYMVTGNNGKWKVASEIFKKYDIELKHIKLETPEIQSHNVEDVSKYSAEWASKELGKAIIKSDVGYYIESLGGFPGPFLRYINDMLTSEQILKMLDKCTNRKVLLKECLTFACPNKETKQFINIEEAIISEMPEGNGSSFDRILVFKGQNHPKSLNSEKDNVEHFVKTLTIYDEMAAYIKKIK